MSQSASPIISRLAPTPSGFLHLGNAVNFVLTWLLTRRAHGKLHLRIDDLDRARLRPQYLENIFRTIEWLGLDYDHGPAGPADFEQNYSQLHHLPAYELALQRLAQVPGLLYASTRSRTSPAETEVPFDTPGAAWRARVPPALEIRFLDAWQGETVVPLGQQMPDFVVRKKDGIAAYQLASIIDDLRLGTTLIVRGLDLQASTAAQLWLARQLPETAAFNAHRIRFHHHPLLTGPDGLKLSKSQQQPLARGIMGDAASPRPVYAAVARLLGLPAAAGESLGALREAFEAVNQ
ncbi:glutamyl-tRNA synthetase [Hymenobacter daecheongensis DSM 21074]|uniref:Glutamyl-tRNA synthetase n=1 Tax=Hymenobacter daecheongensis DSM 21074 TaxID=1121955 RepID=A0A1M6GZR5_9BACT|nr:glutamate--tRNA ligase family protein [Hymenobacter daecheongensis]SHJ15393.1 glutamyl-tRNA synthetase [Hymenobacter daecheongensis DSM 21074]